MVNRENAKKRKRERVLFPLGFVQPSDVFDRELDFCHFAMLGNALFSGSFANRRRLFVRQGVFEGVQKVSGCPYSRDFLTYCKHENGKSRGEIPHVYVHRIGEDHLSRKPRSANKR